MKEPSKKKIGLFLMTGIVIFVLVMGSFLKDKFFIDYSKQAVMYFDESIKGLNVGAPVVFKGVEIGKVSKIDLIETGTGLDFRIPVYTQFNNNVITKSKDKKFILDGLIEKGLRARLTTQSYLTGQLMIELEMLPGTPLVFKAPVPNLFEIPTTLSPLGELSKGLQSVPLKQSVEKFNYFFDTLNAQMPVILPEMQKLIKNANKLVTDNTKGSSEVVRNLNKTLIDLDMAAKSLKNFADYIEQHPDALLKGKGGR